MRVKHEMTLFPVHRTDQVGQSFWLKKRSCKKT